MATTLPLEVFTQRNFVADFFREKLNFTVKNSKIAFYATLWVTYGQRTWFIYGSLESAWHTAPDASQGVWKRHQLPCQQNLSDAEP